MYICVFLSGVILFILGLSYVLIKEKFTTINGKKHEISTKVEKKKFAMHPMDVMKSARQGKGIAGMKPVKAAPPVELPDKLVQRLALMHKAPQQKGFVETQWMYICSEKKKFEEVRSFFQDKMKKIGYSLVGTSKIRLNNSLKTHEGDRRTESRQAMVFKKNNLISWITLHFCQKEVKIVTKIVIIHRRPEKSGDFQ